MPLNIAVCVKRVPDTAADKNLDPTDFTLRREPDESILNPVDEVAVEEALRLKEAHGGEVTVVTVGPEAALTKAARRALSMGCDKAVHLSDPVLHGSDAQAIAYALACVLRRGSYDLIVCGSESTDARTSLVPPALAEYLNLPGLFHARKVEVEGDRVRVQREADQGYDVIEGPLPAVVGINWGANEPRYPSFKGIQGAKNKPVESLTAADVGIESARVGLAGSQSQVLGFAARSAERRRILVDNKDGNAHVKLADFLQEAKLI
ncbi:MAG: electron transfer flavoprotein beta subunit [Actinomycetota bacterium]|jgi:electron transfer flavoprotein beta subunit|nr:electron transfer flavoprotein beta subunit [Actinomycetota bacterium]MEA2535701.1 electron transfer flavoprotein beta subunit [Actinomycetota bacterium]MEA2588763.1 electron transfer flavoprotein beta subunit [Actinomycetota bacterium]MEA2592581.1 electron transfer flavoprotein beta subunit [Actinomycetota bacterium]